MRSRIAGWRWGRGLSLETPPSERDFLQSIGDQVDTVEGVAAVRDQFVEQVSAAATDRAEAALLQESIDALAERAFALAP